MAIRQYIGARYTLKIYENSLDPQSADWEANVDYEPLVMVNYNNSSYISRKQVPASVGDPVSNPTYWALSGLYNGQIASLQQQINDLGDALTADEQDILDLQNDLTTLSGTVSGHTTSIGNLTTDVGNLQTAVSGHTTSIGNLQTAVGNVANLQTVATNVVDAINEVLGRVVSLDEVNNFIEKVSNKSVVIYGDSLSTVGSWVDTFTSLMTALNSTVTLHASGGWTAADALSAANGDNAVYDFAIVWVGINDSNNATTLGDVSTNGTFNYNYYQLLRRIRTVSPNCQTFCLGLSYSTHNSIGTDANKCLYYYDAAVESTAMFSGCTFKTMLGLPNNNEQNNTATSDGTHFTSTYSKKTLAWTIINHLFSSATVPSPDFCFRITVNNMFDNVHTDVTISQDTLFITKRCIYISALFDFANAIAANTNLCRVAHTNLRPSKNNCTPTKSSYGIVSSAGNISIFGAQTAGSAGRQAVIFTYTPKWWTIPQLT